MIDFGIGLLGYAGCWEDAAFAERHGFSSAGFVDSPLLGGDPFVCLGLAARETTTMRVGTFLAIPSNRSAPTTAAAIATVDRIAPGRTFLGLGTGYTGRNTFGMAPIAARDLRDYARECQALLRGEEVLHRAEGAEWPIRFGQKPGLYLGLDPPVPVFIAADGPKALAVTGELADGWITTLQFSSVMGNSDQVFAGAREAIERSAGDHAREFGARPSIWSTAVCVLAEGESAVSPRALEQIGAHAMMPFHSYADRPAIAERLPPPIRERIPVYESEVLARFEGPSDRHYQQAHRGHLSHLLPGEAAVLTEEIVRMTTLTGTATEIAARLSALEAVGLDNVTFWIPPPLARDVIVQFEAEVMPLLRAGPDGPAPPDERNV